MDPRDLSDEKLASILTFLVTFGYIDGAFDPAEQRFVSEQMNRLLDLFVGGTAPDARQRAAVHARISRELDAVYQRVSDEIEAFAGDAPRGVDGDSGESFLFSRLRVRCIEQFRAFSPTEQQHLLGLLDPLMLADQRIAPEEKRLRELLVAAMTPAPALEAPAPGIPSMRVGHPVLLPVQLEDHPLLSPLEQPFSPHPIELASQVEREIALIGHALAIWEGQRGRGKGRLQGVQRVAQLPPGSSFLDGYTYVHRLDPVRPSEIIVLGDLHGCYSCLKGALMQTDFIRRVWLHQWDPVNHPDVKIVFVGDYIDRGRYGLDGVLRTVLQLLVAMPEHVFVLRGNHESFVRTPLGVRSAVYPAEALGSISPYVPPELLEAYRLLFEAMPVMFLSERTIVVHAGIPRDDTFQSYTDLSSLNEHELRFQMTWSDPAMAQHVPLELQRSNARFSFGLNQFRAFMERTGFKTMIRGHEKIDEGFRVIYAAGDLLLLNLFSAGGAWNVDLPLASSYRKVTPMGMTILCRGGIEEAYPWPIDWQTFNAPARNGFLRGLPELPFLSS
jgi:hypothetical protein